MVTEIIVGVAALGLLIYRNLRARPVSANSQRVVLILALVGLLLTVQFLRQYHATSQTYAALGGSLALAAAFGAVRAWTVRLWFRDGQAWMQGNWLTAVLWVLALAAHLGYDATVARGHGNDNVGTATAVLYLAVSLGIQRAVVQLRVQRMQPAGMQAGGSGSTGFGSPGTVPASNPPADEPQL